MASTRDNNIPAIFGDDANTTIPTIPAQGVAYRNSALTPATLLSGFGFDTLADSADINEILHILYELATEVDRSGILGWSETVDYTTLNGVVRGSDGTFYVSTELSGPGAIDGVRDPTNGANVPSHWRTLVDFIGGGAGVGTTDLTVARTATEVTIQSSTGSNATIPSASITQAGVISAADQARLNAVSSSTVAVNLIVMLTSGIYTVPPSLRSLKLTVIGAGSGGGHVNTANSTGNGHSGGGGATAILIDQSVVEGDTITMVVGQGGVSGDGRPNAFSTLGGESSAIGSGINMIATGGTSAGGSVIGANFSVGGLGGQATGGDINLSGQSGRTGVIDGDFIPQSASIGGASSVSHGGNVIHPRMLASLPGPGAGGGGGRLEGVFPNIEEYLPQNGGDGLILIEEFF